THLDGLAAVGDRGGDNPSAVDGEVGDGAVQPHVAVLVDDVGQAPHQPEGAGGGEPEAAEGALLDEVGEEGLGRHLVGVDGEDGGAQVAEQGVDGLVPGVPAQPGLHGQLPVGQVAAPGRAQPGEQAGALLRDAVDQLAPAAA